MFNIGDRVIHPQHGMGQVVKLDDRAFGSDEKRRYYEISIQNAGSTIWVPIEPPAFGLRKLAERSDIEDCRRILTARPSPLPEDARTRQAKLAERLQQGAIYTQCEVVRDLFAFGEHKSLYGSMAGFFKQTQNVLCEEWAIVEGITHEEAVQEIGTLLQKSRRMVDNPKSNK